MIKPITGYIWMMNGFNRQRKKKTGYILIT